MRLTARRIVAIAALTLTTFAATHAGDVSRQAGGIFEHASATHTTIQAGGIFEHASTTYAATPDGGIFE
jgi:hypothetical protein